MIVTHVVSTHVIATHVIATHVIATHVIAIVTLTLCFTASIYSFCYCLEYFLWAFVICSGSFHSSSSSISTLVPRFFIIFSSILSLLLCSRFGCIKCCAKIEISIWLHSRHPSVHYSGARSIRTTMWSTTMHISMVTLRVHHSVGF